MSLVTPDVIGQACIDVLKRRHVEHLAKLERQVGLAARTIEPLKTIDWLAGEGFRLKDDTPPAVLLGVFGVSEQPERQKDGTLMFLWTLAAEVTVLGINRADTLKRRDWYTMTVAECLMLRVPRHAEPIDSLVLLDVELANGEADDQRTVGESRLMFDVRVRQTMDLTALPPDDTSLPPGSPGGPPLDPYAPPVDWPGVRSVTTTTARDPLAPERLIT